MVNHFIMIDVFFYQIPEIHGYNPHTYCPDYPTGYYSTVNIVIPTISQAS
jgi:hypothetical protein